MVVAAAVPARLNAATGGLASSAEVPVAAAPHEPVRTGLPVEDRSYQLFTLVLVAEESALPHGAEGEPRLGRNWPAL